MLVNANCVYLSSEKKQGIKDPTKTYYNALLMQNTDTLICSVPEAIFNTELSQLNQFESVFCSFDFNPVYKSMRLVDIKKAGK